jgi:hypothetical protein
MVEEKMRYSEADLAEFKEIIVNKIEKAKADLELIKSAYMNNCLNLTYTSACFSLCTTGGNKDLLGL